MRNVVMNLVFSNGKNPISVFITFKKQTRSDYLKDIANEAELLIRKKHPEYGPLIDWTYHGHDSDVIFIDDEPDYCAKCMNAYVEPELEPDCDFSSRSVGEANPGYRMMLNSGARRKTHISLERWNEKKEALDASVEEEIMREDVNSSPVVMLVNSLVEQAVRQRASDIHIEAGGIKTMPSAFYIGLGSCRCMP